jgi:hypothetical protein
MTDIASARIFIDEAIEALSIEMYSGTDPRNMERVDDIEATIAVYLERVDSALGPRGQSMFAPMAENVKQAMAALHGAKQALSSGAKQ